MLVEHGFVRAQLQDGREWTFTPSFGRLIELGSPTEIVETFSELHSQRAPAVARQVLAALCDQDDASELIGWLDAESGADNAGAMPEREQVIIARHLMRHGICGRAKDSESGGGDYSARFDAGEFMALARVHLGMSAEQAAALSMSELQQLMETKFPTEEQRRRRNAPTLGELEATERDIEAANARRKEPAHG